MSVKVRHIPIPLEPTGSVSSSGRGASLSLAENIGGLSQPGHKLVLQKSLSNLYLLLNLNYPMPADIRVSSCYVSCNPTMGLPRFDGRLTSRSAMLPDFCIHSSRNH